eukprot:2148228-Rhodomonas_salina.1
MLHSHDVAVVGVPLEARILSGNDTPVVVQHRVDRTGEVCNLLEVTREVRSMVSTANRNARPRVPCKGEVLVHPIAVNSAPTHVRCSHR